MVEGEVPGVLTELSMAEPCMAHIFRRFAESGKHVTVCSLDGSTVKGKVIDVHPDGLTATLENGGADYIFDVTLVSMVKIEH